MKLAFDIALGIIMAVVILSIAPALVMILLSSVLAGLLRARDGWRNWRSKRLDVWHLSDREYHAFMVALGVIALLAVFVAGYAETRAARRPPFSTDTAAAPAMAPAPVIDSAAQAVAGATR